MTDRTRTREIVRKALPKLAGTALAIGSDTIAETAGVALILWRLTKRMTARSRGATMVEAFRRHRLLEHLETWCEAHPQGPYWLVVVVAILCLVALVVR